MHQVYVVASQPCAAVFRGSPQRAETEHSVAAEDIRAVAKALGVLPIDALQSYDRSKRLYDGQFDLRKWLDTALVDGWSLRWIADRPRKGIPRPTVGEFCRKNPKGRFLLKCPQGLVPVVNGKPHTEFTGSPIFGYWERVA